MAKKEKYIIVSDMENGFYVERFDEKAGDNEWRTIVYTCEKKGEEGYQEAMGWIKEQEKKENQ